ncbi:hypothetical protein BDQ17DRAFT_318100 [Cyathus striatus]|nr:hypothetical protein BDQ17DRAFT_318100 [Cyathus striatus]
MISRTFKHLPSNSLLSNLLSRHDDLNCHGFITRLDRSPLLTKRVSFLKGLALNILIIAFVAALASVIAINDLLSINPQPLKLAICLSQDLLIIWAIYVLLRSTTVPFILGECRVRILYGFRPTEVVIRKPPPTMSQPSKGLSNDQILERYWRIATHAINPCRLYSNPSAILSSDYWTLDYPIVLDTYKYIDCGEIQEEQLEFSIWKRDDDVWYACELWRMHEIMSDQQEIVMFKALLTREGRGDLVSVWQDMVPHSDRKADGHIRSPSEQKAYQEIVDKFACEGFDYEALWSRASEEH